LEFARHAWAAIGAIRLSKGGPEMGEQHQIIALTLAGWTTSPGKVPALAHLKNLAQALDGEFRFRRIDELEPHRLPSLAKKAVARLRISRFWRRISFSRRSRFSSAAMFSWRIRYSVERLRWAQRSGCGGLGPDLEGSMSLRPTVSADVPTSTATVAHAAFPRGNAYLRLRDCLGTIFTDAQFSPLFAHRGQPAECPWRLALVTLLQFAENLSDRRAADAVRGRIDWKYLLRPLPWCDGGRNRRDFHPRC
jgi:hypothetical protein